MSESEKTTPPPPTVKKHPTWLRLILVVAILTVGVLAMVGLAALREDPPLAEEEEIVLHSEAMRVVQQDIPVELHGYGTARPHRLAEVTAEISGRVLEVHSELRTGVVVEEGTILAKIDERDIGLSLESARAEVERLDTERRRLDQEETNDKRRLELAKELREIARREFERTRDLVEGDGVETVSALDARLMELTSRENAIAEIENSLALFEARRAQLTAQLRAARSRVDQLDLDLDRATIRAPFAGRIESKHVDIGQRVSPGQVLFVVADDSILEIPASLDGREVARWLNLSTDPVTTHWFRNFNDTHARVRWTEGDADVWFEGNLSRVERYDSATRTFHVVVSVPARQGIEDGPEFFPLTNGMFCHLVLPGRVAYEVVPVPRAAIDSSSQVLVANNGRVETRRVQIARFQDDIALIDRGLEDGEIILLNRPPRVIDGMKVTPILDESDGMDVAE